MPSTSIPGLLDECCACLLQTRGRETHCVFCDLSILGSTPRHILNENLVISKVYTCYVNLVIQNIHLDNCNDDKVALLFCHENRIFHTAGCVKQCCPPRRLL